MAPTIARIPAIHAITICRSCQYTFRHGDETKRTTMIAGLFVDELGVSDTFTSCVGNDSGVFVMVGVASIGPSFIMLVGVGATRILATMVAVGGGSWRAANKCIAPWKRV